MIAVTLAMALRLGDLSGYPEIARLGPLPRDVRALIDGRLTCSHWAGEEPYDRARQREIDRAFRDLRCDTVEREETRLQRRYAKTPTGSEGARGYPRLAVGAASG
jgi:hypothetical protein